MLKLSLACVILLAAVCAAQTTSPVVVELFTSEGCSSCPPADRLLIELDQKQQVDGSDIIVLGEHVDYWDGLGWRDRFSSARFTERQQAYAERFRISGPYTPQMVVNGSTEFVGNDSRTATKNIQQAAHRPTPAATIHVTQAADHLHISITGAGKHAANVLCAITERELTTKVGAGENNGRELHHTAVVRDLRKVGTTRDGSFETDVPLKFSSDWRIENLRAVVFLQSGNAGEILSATQVPLK
jgi:hypothetical protein